VPLQFLPADIGLPITVRVKFKSDAEVDKERSTKVLMGAGGVGISGLSLLASEVSASIWGFLYSGTSCLGHDTENLHLGDWIRVLPQLLLR